VVVTTFGLLYYLGDPHSQNPRLIDRLRKMCISTPAGAVSRLGDKMSGGRASRIGSILDEYFFGGRNRIFTCIYWLLFMGGYFLFAYNSFFPPMIPCMYVSEWHMYFGSIYCFSCWCLYVWLMYADPGVITTENHDQYKDQFEYDQVMYEEKECSTCKFVRPARSKHCRVCDICIGRFDHHCIWINGCVGAGNHRLFMIFLLYHAVFMSYVNYVGGAILLSQVFQNKLEEAWYYDPSGRQAPVTRYMMFQWVVRNYSHLFCVTAFCCLLQFLFYGFFLYQLGLIVRNVTTNETFKFKDLAYAARIHNAKLVMPDKSPYYVSAMHSVYEALAPSLITETRRNPRSVWDDSNPDMDAPDDDNSEQGEDHSEQEVVKKDSKLASSKPSRRRNKKSKK